MSMLGLMVDVRKFHDACGLSDFDAALWRKLLREECNETIEALGFVPGSDQQTEPIDIVEVADGLADIIYIAVGMANRLQIPLHRVWAEVQKSNLTKIGPHGLVEYRADGKVLKGPNYSPPDIRKAIYGEEEQP